MTIPSASSGHPVVSVVVEQLRRPVAGGIGTYTRGLLSGLAELQDRALTVELIASRPSARPDPLDAWPFAARTSALPGPVLTRLWDRGWDRPRTGPITHATSFAYPRPSGRLAVMVHDLAFREVPAAFPPRGRLWHEQRLADALSRAHRFVVPAARTADALVAAGADAAKVVVIAEGADHLPPPDATRAGALLRELGVGERFILTVGTLEPRKNLVRLFEAFGRTGLGRAGWSLVVVGATGWGQQPGDAPEGVAMAGSPDDAVLAGLYRAASLFVYVPLAEGFGLPPVEAMRAGAPVVASTEVPSVGDAAMCVDPSDVDAIAGALVALTADEARRDELGARGAEHASGLTWRRAAAAHLDLWESMR